MWKILCQRPPIYRLLVFQTFSKKQVEMHLHRVTMLSVFPNGALLDGMDTPINYQLLYQRETIIVIQIICLS